MCVHVMDGMSHALAIEARHRRTREGAEQIEVVGGRREAELDWGGLYQFRVPRTQTFPMDKAGILVLGDKEIPAFVHGRDKNGAPGHSIVLTLLGSPPRSIPEALLIVDDAALLEQIRRRVERSRRPWRGFNPSLAFSVACTRCSSRKPEDPLGRGDGVDQAGLNAEQAAAVRAAMKRRVLWLWGPAGTGKTSTLARIASSLTAAGSDILLTAPSNVAVDTLLLRCLDDGLSGDTDIPGRVVRLGPIALEELKARYGSEVGFDAIVRRRREPIEKELLRVGRAITGLRRKLSADASGAGPGADQNVELQDLYRQAKRLEAKYSRVPERVLREARVVATTVQRAALGQTLKSVDRVIIDEASMVPLPMAYLTAGRARQGVVVAGDFRQLAPVVKARDRTTRRWLRRSPFEASGITGILDRGTLPKRLSVLRRQYRMPPEVAEMANRLAYGGVLVTPENGERTSCRDGCGFGSLCYLDTSLEKFETRMPPGSRSRLNEAQASLTTRLAETVAESRCCGDGEIALITPYRAQATHLKQLVSRSPLLSHRAVVDTVHRFQGSERDLVLLDLPDGPGASTGWFMRGVRADHDGVRMSTVAITRAARRLVVVGNFQHLLSAVPNDAWIRRLLHDLMDHGSPVPLPEELPESDERVLPLRLKETSSSNGNGDQGD